MYGIIRLSDLDSSHRGEINDCGLVDSLDVDGLKFGERDAKEMLKPLGLGLCADQNFKSFHCSHAPC